MPRFVAVYCSDEREIFHLLNKPCGLSSVKIVHVSSSEVPQVQFMWGAISARICAEATALDAVFM